MLVKSGQSIFKKNSTRQFSFAQIKPTTTQLLIDGKWVNSITGKTFETLNPSTEKKIVDIQEADVNDVDVAVAAARKAFDHGPWRRMLAKDRARILYNVADQIEKNIDELAALESLDNGKPFFFAKMDVGFCADLYRYYAGWADKIHGQTIPISGPYFCYTKEEPVGVAALITPWNFPILMATLKLAPCIASGSVAILKPAEQTPLTALKLGELFLNAGAPEGVVNVLPGYGRTAGEALVKHKGVDKIAFTGSTAIGRHILMNAGIKRVTLELGGKSPNIILNDADIELAVQQSHIAAFLNSGQICMAGSRTFVQEKIYDQFLEKAVAAAKAKKVGDPFEPTSENGPQISQKQTDKILDYIEKGQQQGAKLLCGGKRINRPGYFLETTVFADVKDHMTIAQEEIFGPVMSVFKFKTIEEAIERANNTEYGLTAGVVTSSLDSALEISNALRSGQIFINCWAATNTNTPFGGFKNSGIGREFGYHGLKNYLESKTVIMKRPDHSLP